LKTPGKRKLKNPFEVRTVGDKSYALTITKVSDDRESDGRGECVLDISVSGQSVRLSRLDDCGAKGSLWPCSGKEP
jgi:hypothetical protein